jgi:hypothetical protein
MDLTGDIILTIADKLLIGILVLIVGFWLMSTLRPSRLVQPFRQL